MPEPTDRELVERCRGGCDRAFETLVLRHARQMHAVAYAHVLDRDAAQDVVQEAFLRAYRSLGRLESADRFRPWLSRIVFRCAQDYLRKQVEVSMDPTAMPAPTPERVTDQERFEDAEDVRALLTRALRSLPLHLRAPLLMFHMDDSTYAEISDTVLPFQCLGVLWVEWPAGFQHAIGDV